MRLLSSLTIAVVALVLAFATVPGATVSATAASGDVVYSGTFEGAGGKRSGGTFEILEDDGKRFIRLSDDFHLSSVPDPKLAFGHDGYARGTIYAKLTAFRGAQVYEIPAHLDPATFNQVWIWCERFDVPLAVAGIGAVSG